MGVIFVIDPGSVTNSFNILSRIWGFALIPDSELAFYPILGSAYMYLVTLFAFMIYKNPVDRFPAVLLINAKLTSAILSFLLFVFGKRYLIYLANGVVDGSIGLAVLYFYNRYGRNTEK